MFSTLKLNTLNHIHFQTLKCPEINVVRMSDFKCVLTLGKKKLEIIYKIYIFIE